MSRRTGTIIRIALWAGAAGFVIAVGMLYFPREQPMGMIEAFYHTLRLFIFESDLNEFPKSRMLVFIYFVAPAITVSAIGTVITYLFRLTPVIRLIWISDHVIICGLGRTGMILATTLKERGVPVVCVDLGPPENFEDWCEEHRITIIYGDFHSEAILRRAGADRARSVIFASGSDMANLEGAVNIYDYLRTVSDQPRIIWTHIANERLAEIARHTIRTEFPISIRFIDTYWIAASKMISQYFDRPSRRGILEIYILGFGKFGRDLTEVLIRDQGVGEYWMIHVVDAKDVRKEVQMLAEEFNVLDRLTFTQTAIQDLRPNGGDDRAFFLCTDDDIGNLTVALMLTGQMKPTRILVRMTTWPISAIADHLGRDQHITFVNINELVKQGVEAMEGIFQPATPDDLKRVKDNRSPS